MAVTTIRIGTDQLRLGDPGFVCVRDIQAWWVAANPDNAAAGYQFVRHLESEGRRTGSPRLADGTPDYCAIAELFKRNNARVRTIQRRTTLTSAQLSEPFPRYIESPELKAWLDQHR